MTDQQSAHTARVAAVAAAVKANRNTGQPLQIQKGGVSHFVPLPNDARSAGRPVDISSLNHVIAIDPARSLCIAEPGISFAELVPQTLAHGLIPTVVPELKGITLGGAVAGCSVEAMSYRYGGFHDSCLEYELVTGEGETVVCSPENDPLLFDMIHGSYGTLAILTQITFKLVPAKPFVRMEYHCLNSFADFERELLARCAAADYALIDAIIHDAQHLVLCLGNFVEKAPYVSGYSRTEIFYKSTLARQEDYLTTFDYCFRYDAECHWLTRTFPPLEWKPVRWALGSLFLGSTNLIRWSNRLEKVLALKRRPDVVCDVFISQDRFAEFLKWYDDVFNFYPLWVVPYQPPKVYPWINDSYGRPLQTGMLIDCAIYGKPNSEPNADYSALLEEEVFKLNGLKTLISRNHYSRERFWQIYNEDNYRAAKERLDPRGAFPSLYEKFHAPQA